MGQDSKACKEVQKGRKKRGSEDSKIHNTLLAASEYIELYIAGWAGLCGLGYIRTYVLGAALSCCSLLS